METIRKKLTNVGNSKGLTFSAGIIQEYGLEQEVIIEKREEGVLIRAYKPSFQNKLEELRKNKDKIYRAMEKQASNKEIQAYYASSENIIVDIDNDIID